MKKNYTVYLTFLILTIQFQVSAQTVNITGIIHDLTNKPLPASTVFIAELNKYTVADSLGRYELKEIPYGKWILQVEHVGFKQEKKEILVNESNNEKNITLTPNQVSNLDEIVISGTMKEVTKLDSPVPVEVYSSQFFKANPTPSLFDALQNINGVRPQLNCNVCNTGDIHINGLEGPYTMILIDGMPIVSGLSTVYGLSGIPQSLIDRVEVVKGPASTLYGSEAVGGLINVITKKTQNAPLISADIFSTSWRELNADFTTKLQIGKRAQTFIGANYFKYANPQDKNNDNFTDVTLQDRISIFNKWTFQRNENRIFSLAGRYIYEDRWGGEMNWTKIHRGGNNNYGESIYTSRWELFGNYQLPIKEKVLFQFSGNGHHQNSVYGALSFLADQYTGFGQLAWYKTIIKHDMLAGLTYRFTHYDDNTPATAAANNLRLNQPTTTHLPGLFVQDEYAINNNNKLLMGLRYDYNSIHGSILTPRINYKWNSRNLKNVIRLSIGNGYRVANVFTEDHAALTGAREVVFRNQLKPETSWNANINFTKKINTEQAFIGLDATIFYTRFGNKIIPNYEIDANKIIYDNIKGHAISRGLSLNADISFYNGLKMLAGATAMDLYTVENGIKSQQMFTEKFTGVWNIGYTFKNINLTLDYTGNVYSPMRLPLLSDLDPRSEFSPWWSIQNIQVSKSFVSNLEIYGGVKNLLNWTPGKKEPFLIARANDPFDKNVQFDNNHQPIPTTENPYGLTFDPTYQYAANQGIRYFIGL